MKVFNTLTGRKEEFVPQGDEVKMYVCGVTPYDQCHIGHAMSYIIFDVIRRHLEYRGYKVRHVQNFTDIDDKLIARAQSAGIPTHELAEQHIAQYFIEMDALNIKRAHVYPRATQEVPKIIEIIEGLLAKGHAYAVDGDVYFRVETARHYGKLSHRSLDDMVAGARVEVSAGKVHPMDFALWKSTKPGEPSWPSPWGPGRPGWHIECSAMSLAYLGKTLDIHGGGQDLVFPHHENEIAQSEAFTGVTPFVRYWLHNGLMQLGEEKMSKSLGNLVTIQEALTRYAPDAVRLFVLGSHYRKPLTYSEDALAASERALERLRSAAHIETSNFNEAGVNPEPYRQRFFEAMDDDFNSAQALASLFDLAREINRGRELGVSIAQAQRTMRELAGLLGLTLKLEGGEDRLAAGPFVGLLETTSNELAATGHSLLAQEVRTGLEELEGDDALAARRSIELLVGTRDKLRAAKAYILADNIRASLEEHSVILEDTPQGTVWKVKR